MKKNMFLAGFCFCVVIFLILPNCYAFSSESPKSYSQEQPRLQYSITTNIDNVKSIFQFITVTVTIKNLENETIQLDIGGYPGGRFNIYDDDSKLINAYPKYFLTLLWRLTLEPEEEYTLYKGTWFQRNIFYRLVRNGEYHIYGGTGIIYFNEEPITPDPFGPVNITIARRFIP